MISAANCMLEVFERPASTGTPPRAGVGPQPSVNALGLQLRYSVNLMAGEITAADTLPLRLTEPSAIAPAIWLGEPDDEPTGALIDTSKEYSTSLSGLFDRIVLDEVHRVKNPRSSRQTPWCS